MRIEKIVGNVLNLKCDCGHSFKERIPKEIVKCTKCASRAFIFEIKSKPTILWVERLPPIRKWTETFVTIHMNVNYIREIIDEEGYETYIVKTRSRGGF